jgi:arabinogalactan oligomer/maltooligosaccharide transport system permease protein
MKSLRFEKDDSPFKIVLIYAILILFCALSVYPVLNVLSIALRPANMLFSTSLRIIPKDATLDNFKQAFIQYPLLKWLINSFIISSLTAIAGVIAYSRICIFKV